MRVWSNYKGMNNTEIRSTENIIFWHQPPFYVHSIVHAVIWFTISNIFAIKMIVARKQKFFFCNSVSRVLITGSSSKNEKIPVKNRKSNAISSDQFIKLSPPFPIEKDHYWHYTPNKLYILLPICAFAKYVDTVCELRVYIIFSKRVPDHQNENPWIL